VRSDTTAWIIDRTALTRLRWRVPVAWFRRCCIRLLIPIASHNHDLEILTVIPKISCSGRVNAAAPERAFVVCDGAWVWAGGFGGGAFGGVERRVALNVDVEAGTESRVVAVLGAAEDVVGGERVQAEVGVCAYRGVEIFEGVDVAGWCLGGERGLVEGRVRLEGGDGVGAWMRAVAVGLGCAGVFGVDEAAWGG
jgi:hypothetical protein